MYCRKTLDDVVERALILESGPVRARVQVRTKISDVSHITQHIVLDAGCPFLKFETDVS